MYCRYRKHPEGSEHEGTFFFSFFFIPLSVSVHINHFFFIHLPFHNMPITVAIMPAFPPFLVSSFIVLISAPRARVSLRHSPSISTFFFSGCLQCIIYRFTLSLSPSQCLHFNTQEKSLFPSCPMAMKQLSTSEVVSSLSSF